MFNHKYLDHEHHELMNTINYMSSQWREGYTFAGFIPLVDNNFGVNESGYCYTAVHLSTKPLRSILSDNSSLELKFIESGKSWAALLYGSDNSSFIKRFDTEERMHKWFGKLKELKQDDSWLWYNS